MFASISHYGTHCRPNRHLKKDFSRVPIILPDAGRFLACQYLESNSRHESILSIWLDNLFKFCSVLKHRSCRAVPYISVFIGPAHVSRQVSSPWNTDRSCSGRLNLKCVEYIFFQCCCISKVNFNRQNLIHFSGENHVFSR